jgi:hypothetical protein
MASTPQNEHPRVLPVIDAAAEQRRALDAEIAQLILVFHNAPLQHKDWLRRRIDGLIAMRDAGVETTEPEASAEELPNFSNVPPAAAAPMMGNMANTTGRFVRREPRRLTAIFSTPEQRATAAIRRRQAEDASIPAPTLGYQPPTRHENSAIPVCDLGTWWTGFRPPPVNLAGATDLSAAMP